MSIFPLVVSLYLSLSRLKFAKGGFTVNFIGLLNYQKLLFGSQQFHFLGTLAPLSPVAGLDIRRRASARWPVACARCRRGRRSLGRLVGRARASSAAAAAPVAGRCAPIRERGRPARHDRRHADLRLRRRRVQYLLGLGLALLCAQKPARPALLPGRVPPADDDHAGRRRLHLPHAHRHDQGAVRAVWGSPWAWRLRLGGHSLGRADRA